MLRAAFYCLFLLLIVPDAWAQFYFFLPHPPPREGAKTFAKTSFLGEIRQEAVPLLRSGPMVGYVTATNARFWVQTAAPALVQLVLQDSAGVENRTNAIRTVADSVFIAQLRADSLKPATEYRFRLLLDGQSVSLPYELRFRTAPLAKTRPFTFATGSCAFVPEPYEQGQPYEIFASIAAKRPDLMLWLGDNVYLQQDEWASLVRRRARYAHTRALPQLQPLWGSTSHVAIWDDHDFGPNDADRTTVNRREARETFDLFWPNPPKARPESGGLTTSFRRGNVEFFLLDNRSFRSPEHTPRRTRTQLGADQISWLLRSLRASTATFKIIATGGQALSPGRRGETFANGYNRERRALLDSLRHYAIPGIFLLTGDRHYTELSRLKRRKAPALYELTVSPFTSGLAKPRANRFRVRGTLVHEHNFATVTVAGDSLTLRVFGADGKLRWERVIRANE